MVPYRAPYFFGEPRLANPKLTTLEVTVGGGKTSTGFDQSGEEVNILSLYGAENLRNLAQGVPADILNRSPGSILNNLWETSLPGFGQVDISGYFKLAEVNLNYQHNLPHNFFVELNLPMRKLELVDLRFTDLSTAAEAGSVNFGSWKNFVGDLAANLEPYGVCLVENHLFNFGDAFLGVGWTQTNLDNPTLDYWDTTIKLGVMVPLAPRVCPEFPLMVSPGYNRTWAFPFSFACSLGLFEWLTWGTYLEGVLFTHKYQYTGFKTASAQNGLVKLASGLAKVEKGNIWQFGTFIKSDHMPWGLSVVVGYGYSTEQRTWVRPTNLTLYDFNTVNSDVTLQGWHMHTINVNFEYDFAVESDRRGWPRLRMNFDIPVAGQWVFKNSFFSGTIALDLLWD